MRRSRAVLTRYLLVILALAVALVGLPSSATARLAVDPPPVQEEPTLPYTEVRTTPAPPAEPKPETPRQGVVWPAAATGDAAITPASKTGTVRAGETPILLGATANPKAGTQSFKVDVADQGATGRARVSGLLFSLKATSGPGPVSVTVDYATFANAIGGNFGNRLRLSVLPACARTTPEVPACQVSRPLKSVNDGKNKRVSADVATEDFTDGASVLAATAGPSGSNGDFAASSLAPSGSWSMSGASGSFAWSYPIPLPPAAAHSPVVPEVQLSYDSGSVDGRMAATNNQPSWVGQGWDYSPGYVERTYRSCSDDTTLPDENQTGDQCWAGEIVTLNFGGKSTAVVRDDASGSWHLKDDDGEKIERLTGAQNGAREGEHWRITTTDGIQYYFGLDTLPGDTNRDNQTESVLTAPVYGPHSGDPCYNSDGFAKSSCTQAWRWNLDYAEDRLGNASAYYYKTEANYYGANNKTDPVAYLRGGYLSRVDYGLRNVNGSIFGAPTPQRVSFTVTERCVPTSTFKCELADFTEANAKEWPDTPQDQKCDSTGTCDVHSPTFWSRKRLTEIRTEYRSGNNYLPVDTFTLGQSFPTTGDPSLRLDSIARTGYAADGSKATTPTVSFVNDYRANRVTGFNDQPPMLHHRITQINTETGQIITVHYSGDDGQEGRAKPLCTATTVPTKPELTDTECYPVYWTPQYSKDPILDYFHKYVVTEVDVADRIATSPTRMTTYTYLGNPAWHSDDNEVVKAKHRTFGQFRGYGTVQTRTGNPNAASNGTADKWTLSTATYFRGMNNDRIPGGRRSASVTNSLGESTVDDDRFADTALEVRTFDADGGTQVNTELSTRGVVATSGKRAREGLDDLTANIARVTRSRKVTTVAAGGTMTATTDSSYDTLGRLTRQSETGTNVAAKCTTTSYADDVDKWIRNKPAEVIVSAQPCPTPGTAQSPIMARTRSYYDGSSTLGEVSGKGQPSMALKALDDTHWAKTTASFDEHGRELATTVYTSASDTTGRTTRKKYYPTTGGPLTRIDTVNALNQTASSVLDPGRGKPITNTDVAGLVTSADYDPLGRTVKVWTPGQTKGTDPPSTEYSYQVSQTAPLAVTTKTLVDTGSGASYRTAISIYDAAGGLRQTQTDAVGGGRAVSDTFTDSHGWTVRANNRWYTTGAPSTTLITTADSGIDSRTVTSYDGAGRQVLATEYKGTTATWSTKTTYSGDRTTVTPPAGGVQTTTVVNAHGQNVELLQWTSPPTIAGNVVSGGTAQRTTYAYDALGRQQSVTTAAGTAQATTWTTTFDVGGRTIAKSDPDSGATSSTYNDVGDMLTAKDAGQRVVGYVYDKLGRKVEERDGSPTGPLLASWTFDTIKPGRLTSSTRFSPTGNVTIATSGYDAVGNQLGVRTELNEPGFLGSYTTSYGWTGTHLMKSETLPSSEIAAGVGVPAETITYGYDASGNPKSSSGINAYVSNTSYSPFGEANQFTLGVNTLTGWLTYNRDAQTRRVTQVNLSGQTAPPQLENIAYTYDPAGNITRSVDTQGAPGAAVQTQCYTYDKLRQLTQAWSSTDNCATNPTTLGNNSKVGGPQKFWTTWTIDAAGNRTKQVQNAVPGSTAPTATTTYTMGAAGHAHALSSTSTTAGTATTTTSYGYDANGNMTSRTLPSGTQTIAYDGHDRVRTITAGTKTVEYANDADGNQVLRRSDGVTTLYLPGQEIARNTSTGAVTVTKYYKHGGTVVATRINQGNPIYLMSDLHGSNQVAVSPTNWSASRRYLDPYGNVLGTPSGTWPDAHGFLDKPKDPTTGLTDLGARKYDSTTGRFLSVDPVLDVANPQQFNGYSYATNNPIGNSDATGLRPIDENGDPYTPTPPSQTKPSKPSKGSTPAAPSPGGSAGNEHPKDYTSEHNRAVREAAGIIMTKVGLAGGNPYNVKWDRAIADGSKKDNGNIGFADITYEENGTVLVWEVKSLSEAHKAKGEAEWYAAKIRATKNAELGWSIGGPYPILGSKNYITGPEHGVIIYHPLDHPKRPTPYEAPVRIPVAGTDEKPVHIPISEPPPMPVLSPSTGEHKGIGSKIWGGVKTAGKVVAISAGTAVVVAGVAAYVVTAPVTGG